MFELASPWVLLLFPIPFLLWFLGPRAKTIYRAAFRIPFFHALEQNIWQQNPSIQIFRDAGCFILIWLLLVLALAGPKWVGEPLPVTRNGRNIMLVLDLSGSMELNDMSLNGRPVTRLSIVKQAARAFVENRIGDRIGLILFGSQAYLQTPLTFDRQNVLSRIDDASVGLAGKTTSIGDAIGLAVKRLQKVAASSRVIILLTDGANNSGVLAPLKAAELAKEDEIKIYTIGLGSDDEANVISNALFTGNLQSDLDEETLLAIAKLTGGQYFRATDMASLSAIYEKINALEPIADEATFVRPEKDYYPWILGLAFLLFFVWLVNKSILPWIREIRVLRQEPNNV